MRLIMPSVRECWATLSDRAHRRSCTLVKKLPSHIERAAPWWIFLVLAIAILKMATAIIPPTNFSQFADMFLIYALLTLSPVFAWRLAIAAYPAGHRIDQPQFRFAKLGRWHGLDRGSASRHPLFGPTGMMASLLVGIILNVPVRSFEFMLAVPAMHSAMPDWGQAIFLAMAFDAIAMNFLYAMCFVMALRAVPLFPRMLLAVWMIDIALQLGIAKSVAANPDLPATVVAPLADLLEGNLTKVFISITVWLPYLLLSERVNVTYRHRAAIAA